MIFISIEDFYEKAALLSPISRMEEIEYARRMQNGDGSAREKLAEGYLPFIAAHIKHSPERMQTLGYVLYCVSALEEAIDSFDFFQESEPFSHRLNWALRQAAAKYIVRVICQTKCNS